MSDEDQDYSLVMPFVVVTSEGGPYDDESFVAGFQSGRIYERMSQGEAEFTEMVNPDLFRQCNLIARRYGYTMQTHRTGDDENWREITFRSHP